MSPRPPAKPFLRGLKLAALLLALLVQILAPAGAQIAMARAMQSGETPICAPIHWADGKSSTPRDRSPHRPDSCCVLCGLAHAGATAPPAAPAVAARRIARRLAPIRPRIQSRRSEIVHALRPPARASPSV